MNLAHGYSSQLVRLPCSTCSSGTRPSVRVRSMCPQTAAVRQGLLQACKTNFGACTTSIHIIRRGQAPPLPRERVLVQVALQPLAPTRPDHWPGLGHVHNKLPGLESRVERTIMAVASHAPGRSRETQCDGVTAASFGATTKPRTDAPNLCPPAAWVQPGSPLP